MTNTNVETGRQTSQPTKNIGVSERVASVIIGAGLLLSSGRRGFRGGLLNSILGAGLLYRGVSGHCPIYGLAGINSMNVHGAAVIPRRHGVMVEKVITVDKPVEDLYQFWRNPENFPRFMSHVASVRPETHYRSHWEMKSLAGLTYQWDAEIINEIENTLIGWQSLPGGDVTTAGSVNFDTARNGRSTQVSVHFQYAPPASRAGSFIAMVFGREPSQTVREDLRRLLASLGLAGEVELYTYRPAFEADPVKVEPLAAAITRAHEAIVGTRPTHAAPPFSSMWRDINPFNEMRIPALTYGPGVSVGAGTFGMKISDLVTGAGSTR